MNRCGSLGPATAALDTLLASTAASAALDDLVASPVTAALEVLSSNSKQDNSSIEPVSGKKRRKKRTLKNSNKLGMQDLFDAVCVENNEQAFPSIAWDFDDDDGLSPPPAKKPNSSPSLGLLMRSPPLGKTGSAGRLAGLSRSKSHRSSMSSLERTTSHHFGRNIQ